VLELLTQVITKSQTCTCTQLSNVNRKFASTQTAVKQLLFTDSKDRTYLVRAYCIRAGMNILIGECFCISIAAYVDKRRVSQD